MSHRKETEAMASQPIEDWARIPWRKLERKVYRLQKRIYQASLRGNDKAVHNLQRLLMKSQAARTLAVRRVTQDNQGKRTAGIDGVKSVEPAQRLVMVQRLRHHKTIKPVLTSSIASLLRLRFVEQRDLQPGTGDRFLALTGSGQEAVKQGPPPVPARTTGRFLFNALTESIVSPGEEARYPDQVQGLFVLPPNEVGKPKMSKFVEKEADVKAVLKDEPAFKDATILRFLKLREVAACYFAPVTVVVLEHRETHERTVAVYRNTIQQRPETVQLQFLLDSKKFAIPAMGTPPRLQEKEIRIPTQTLPVDTVQEINKVVENEQKREEYRIQVEEHKMRKIATQDARERQELEEKLNALQQEIREREQIIQQLQKQLQPSQVEFLRTDQHRARLFQAAREAKERLIILSSWINLDA
ncbi:MAG TPA: reverse transcriptase N-terminal domain-containing protein, partial [Ktedonobacteraceae bacterium]|nr:reverse transcriptase N-terminal domain-containing protein [Ktedonobacteraceae bacterium]